MLDDLHKVDIPMLLLNGVYDLATDIAMRPFFERCPKVKWAKLPNSAHNGMWEDRERYMRCVGDFLNQD